MEATFSLHLESIVHSRVGQARQLLLADSSLVELFTSIQELFRTEERAEVLRAERRLGYWVGGHPCVRTNELERGQRAVMVGWLYMSVLVAFMTHSPFLITCPITREAKISRNLGVVLGFRNERSQFSICGLEVNDALTYCEGISPSDVFREIVRGFTSFHVCDWQKRWLERRFCEAS